MKLITEEWVNKAEGDFATAQRESQVENMPNYDAVCFHSQQCIEKYLKACLQELDFGQSWSKKIDESTLRNSQILDMRNRSTDDLGVLK